MGAPASPTTGFNYFGSVAQIICFGSVDKLNAVYNGDTAIWTGPIYRDQAMDGDGKTALTTTIGTIYFYWGTATQNPDALLQTLFLDQGAGGATVPIPAYRNIAYAVCSNIAFGQQVTPPTLLFDLSRFSQAVSLNKVTSVLVTAGGTYTSAPAVVFTGGGGTGAAATANIGRAVSSVTMTNHGTVDRIHNVGYQSAPAVSFVGGGGSGAAGYAVLNKNTVDRVVITNGGSGYTSAPTVVFTGGGPGGVGAAGTAIMTSLRVESVTITDDGDGYTSAPTVSFTGGGGTGAAATATTRHEINGDAVIPEVIYDLLTNNLYGMGLSVDHLITQDFEDAALTVIAEGLGASPQFDTLQTIREILGKLIVYVDSFLYFQGGKIGYKLIRKTDLSLAEILTADDFTDEPKPVNRGLKETWNFTLLTFTDRLNLYEQGVEGYHNPANAEAVGLTIPRSVQYPFITLREVAQVVAKRVGLKAAIPPVFYSLRLLPQFKRLNIGDVVKVTWPKLDLVETPCRITEIVRGRPDSPEIEATLMVEQTRDDSHDYLPPLDFFATAATIDAHGRDAFDVVAPTPRLAELPAGLLGTSADGWLTAYERTDQMLRLVRVLWTWDPIQKAYTEIFFNQSFPIFGDVVCWHQITLDTWILRIRFEALGDYQTFPVYAANYPDFYGALGYRKAKLVGTPSDVQQLTALWVKKVESGYFAAVDTDCFDIEVTVGTFGADIPAVESVATPASTPGRFCYFGRLQDLAIFTTDQIQFARPGPNAPVDPHTNLSADTNLQRIVKVLAANHEKELALSDVDPVTFDRDDTTQTPDGSMSRDWGERSLPTSEWFDLVGASYFEEGTDADFSANIADIDAALGAIYAGTQTANQNLLFDPIDRALGFVHESMIGLYAMKP